MDIQAALKLAGKVADRKHPISAMRLGLVHSSGPYRYLYAVSGSSHDQYGQELDESSQLIVRIRIGDAELSDEPIWYDLRTGLPTSRPDSDEIYFWTVLSRLHETERCEVPTEVSTTAMRDVLRQTLHAVSKDVTRAAMSSLLVERLDSKSLRFVGTDGHRLACLESSLAWPRIDERTPDCGAPQRSILIPRTALDLLDSRLRGRDRPSSLLFFLPSEEYRNEWRDVEERREQRGAFGRNHSYSVRVNKLVNVRQPRYMVVYCGDVTIAVRLSSTTYPPYDQVMPKEWTRRVTVSRKALLEALDKVHFTIKKKSPELPKLKGGGLTRASGVSPAEVAPVNRRVTYTVRRTDLDLETCNDLSGAERKELRATLPATLEGSTELFRITLDADYMRDALEATRADTVSIRLNDELDPIRIDTPDRKLTQIVMPMRP